MRPRISQPRERILMGILAASLLFLGVPQVIRSAGRLGAGLGLGAEEEVKSAALRHAAEQSEMLDVALADPQGSLRGGLLRLKLALPAGGTADKTELAKAAGDLEQGLARAPTDARAWAGLAHADLALDRPDAAAKALSAGLFADHADPYLNPSWCVLGLALWPRLDAADQARIAEEIRWAWRDRRALILALARADASSAVLLRNALEEPERTEFDQRLQATGDW